MEKYNFQAIKLINMTALRYFTITLVNKTQNNIIREYYKRNGKTKWRTQ